MYIKEFLALEGRKIIVTDRVGNVNKLMRRASGDRKAVVKECTALSVRQIAKELVAACCAMNGEVAPELVGTSTQIMELTLLLKKGQYDFLKDNTKEISTSLAILRALEQVRLNPTTEEYASGGDKKIEELKEILERYENRLAAAGKMDYPMLLRKALQVLEGLKKDAQGESLLKFMLPWLNDCKPGKTAITVDGEQKADLELTGDEALFLEMLWDIAKVPAPELIEYGRMGEKPEAHFIRAYGIANEIRAVADRIESRGIPYGEVTIMYAGHQYENFLRAELDKRGIAYTFPRGINASNFHFVQLILDILNFAAGDFEYARLQPVVKNGIFTVSGARKSFRYVNDAGIGWGRQRYLEFFDAFEAMPEDSRLKKNVSPEYVQFLKDLIEALNPDASAEEMFTAICRLATEYSYKPDVCRKNIQEELKSQALVYRLVEDIDFERNLRWFTDYFNSVKLQSGEQPGAVNILPYGGKEVIDRKYWFVLGLSTENIAATNPESPVLNDTELRRYIAGGKVDYALEINSKKREAFRRTHAAFYGDEVTFCYTGYDTVELLANSKSLLYGELLAEYGKKEDEDSTKNDVEAVGYVLPAADLSIKLEVEDLSAYGENAETGTPADTSDETKTPAEQTEEKAKAGADYSPSSLQTLLNCPMKYYYEKKVHVRIPEFRDRNAENWLPANARGNVFHHVLDKYIKKAIIEQKKTTADAALTETLLQEEIAAMKALYPIPSDAIFADEVDELKKGIDAYIIAMHKDLITSGHDVKIIGTEIEYKNYIVTGKMPEEEADDNTSDEAAAEEAEEKLFNIVFNGSVDRMDGYMDGDELHLLIYDYKTGNMEKLIHKIAKYLQIQHCVYAPAMLQWAKEPDNRAYLETLFGRSFTTVTVDSVTYHFPFEDAPDNVFTVEAGIDKLPEYVLEILQQTEGYFRSGEPEKAIANMAELTLARMEEEVAEAKEKKEKPKDFCEYCNYKAICRLKVRE